MFHFSFFIDFYILEISVTTSKGEWSIVQGLPMSDFAKEKMRLTSEELLQERAEAEEVCKE
jgi:malate dehydrogenase